MQVYVSKDSRQYGPFTVEQLRECVEQGNFTEDDLACYDGWDWVAIAKVPGFADEDAPAGTRSQAQRVPVRRKPDARVVQQPEKKTGPVFRMLAYVQLGIKHPVKLLAYAHKQKKFVLWSSIGGGASLLAVLLISLLVGDADDAQKKPEERLQDNEGKPKVSETPPETNSIQDTKPIDLNDPTVREQIIAEATDGDKLQKRGWKGEELSYLSNQQTLFTGWQKQMHANGKVHSLIHFKDGKMDGLSIAWHENGQKKTEGRYRNGMQDGLWSSWYESGQVSAEENYTDGTRHGASVKWYEDGRKQTETYFKDGEPDGKVTSWFPNGQKKSEFFFEDGKYEGHWVLWHENGKIQLQGNCKNGLRDGKWVLYDEGGIELDLMTYKDGHILEEAETAVEKPDFDDPSILDGLIKKAATELEERNGRMHQPRSQSPYTGWHAEFHQNGAVQKLIYYKEGKAAGKELGWHANGKKGREGTYEDGKLMTLVAWKPNGEKCPVTKVVNGNGTSVSYSSDGTESFRFIYKDGELISEIFSLIEQKKPFTVPGLSMDMLWCSPGKFGEALAGVLIEGGRGKGWIWSRISSSRVVTVEPGFWLGKFEVTQAQWMEVMGHNPSYFKEADRPVERVSWEDAGKFCEKLTERESKADRLPKGFSYQLPTEVQWEYACRAGTNKNFAFGNTLTSREANFDGDSPFPTDAPKGPALGRTTTVGSYRSNSWGFYDMHGNVAEWCKDGQAFLTEGYNMFRGGSYRSSAYNTASGADYSERIAQNGTSFSMSSVGFRTSLRPAPTPAELAAKQEEAIEQAKQRHYARIFKLLVAFPEPGQPVHVLPAYKEFLEKLGVADVDRNLRISAFAASLSLPADDPRGFKYQMYKAFEERGTPENLSRKKQLENAYKVVAGEMLKIPVATPAGKEGDPTDAKTELIDARAVSLDRQRDILNFILNLINEE